MSLTTSVIIKIIKDREKKNLVVQKNRRFFTENNQNIEFLSIFVLILDWYYINKDFMVQKGWMIIIFTGLINKQVYGQEYYKSV